jgi:hypothetical protein
MSSHNTFIAVREAWTMSSRHRASGASAIAGTENVNRDGIVARDGRRTGGVQARARRASLVLCRPGEAMSGRDTTTDHGPTTGLGPTTGRARMTGRARTIGPGLMTGQGTTTGPDSTTGRENAIGSCLGTETRTANAAVIAIANGRTTRFEDDAIDRNRRRHRSDDLARGLSSKKSWPKRARLNRRR